MKIDFTKINILLKENKHFLFLFFSVTTTFFMYNIHYVMITRHYILLFINVAYGLAVFLLFDVVIGKKIYDTKLDIKHSDGRKDNNVKENIGGKEGKNDTK